MLNKLKQLEEKLAKGQFVSMAEERRVRAFIDKMRQQQKKDSNNVTQVSGRNTLP